MTTPNRSPLWKVMQSAYFKASSQRHGYAAEIRALRDRLMPEELQPLAGPRASVSIQWAERQRLRAMLTTEADRAEKGDG